jgi:hypothetical protein
MAPRRQCAKCPWKVGVDPYDIPGGYNPTRHENLVDTIARPGEVRLGGTMRMMACHESGVGAEVPCVGWMHNQMGVGNNLALRIAVMSGRVDGNIEVVGPQHERIEDTLPRERKQDAQLRSARKHGDVDTAVHDERNRPSSLRTRHAHRTD